MRSAGRGPSSSSSFSSRAAAAGPRGASTALGRAAQPGSRTGEQRRGSGAEGSGAGWGKTSIPGPGEGGAGGLARQQGALRSRAAAPGLRPASVCLSVVTSLPRGTWWGCGRPCPAGRARGSRSPPGPARRRPDPGRGVPCGAAARALRSRPGRGASSCCVPLEVTAEAAVDVLF